MQKMDKLSEMQNKCGNAKKAKMKRKQICNISKNQNIKNNLELTKVIQMQEPQRSQHLLILALGSFLCKTRSSILFYWVLYSYQPSHISNSVWWRLLLGPEHKLLLFTIQVRYTPGLTQVAQGFLLWVLNTWPTITLDCHHTITCQKKAVTCI